MIYLGKKRADQICTRCINDCSVPGIYFDNDRVCNYCKEYDRLSSKLKDFSKLEKLFFERLRSRRNQGEYDVLIGISGGKDSTYLLDKLLREYKCRVRTFTFDNGFTSPWAKKSVEDLVSHYQVDHSTISIPQDSVRTIYKKSIEMTAAPCSACAYAMYASTVKLAQELSIPIAIHGRARNQMFRFLAPKSPDPFVDFVYDGLKAPSEVDLRETLRNVLGRIEKNLPKDFVELLQGFLPNVEEGTTVEFLPYFLYHPYDEREIISHIEENCSWTLPKQRKHALFSHYDCLVHDGSHYLYQVAKGQAHILPEISVLIREGILSRKQALDVLKENLYNKVPQTDLKYLAKVTGMSREELLAIAKAHNEASNRNLKS